jgi:polyhydroxyalkanoate synthesis regulator phasin
MGLLAKLAMLPLAPAAGVVWLAEQIRQEAEAQLSGPASIRDRLAALDEQLASGEISAEERQALEDELLEELLAPHDLGVTGGG